MRVGEVRVAQHRLSVGVHRLVAPSRLLEQHAEVEVGGGVVGVEAHRLAILRLGAAALVREVEQAAEVDVGLGQIRVQLQGALVGLARPLGRPELELAAGVVPVRRRERGLEPGGATARLLRERRRDLRDPSRPGARRRGRTGDDPGARGAGGLLGALGDLAGVEVEQHLAGVGPPAAAAVGGHDLLAVGVDRDAGDRHVGGELLAQRGPDAPDLAHRHARFEQAARGAEQQQVLEAERERADRAALRGQEPGASQGAQPRLGDLEDARGVAQREALRRRQVGVPGPGCAHGAALRGAQVSACRPAPSSRAPAARPSAARARPASSPAPPPCRRRRLRHRACPGSA